MLIAVVDSLTGQGMRFAAKLGIPYVKIQDYVEQDEPILLLTRSFNFGEVSNEAHAFMDTYGRLVKGVAVSGNRNWGTNYGAAGDKISQAYGVELVLKYEGSGLSRDVDAVKDWIAKEKRV